MMYANKNPDGYLYFIYANKTKLDKALRSTGVELSV